MVGEAMAARPQLIRARGLGKRYSAPGSDPVQALERVDFDVYQGEFISIVGPSGCGKSTLLKILAGLLPYSSGELHFNGQRVTRPSHEVGMVFQAPILLPWRTILQNVLLPVEIRRLDQVEYERSARKLLALVGLAGFENRYPSDLSGGMQQRAAIVRALVQDPRVLLMDEPFGALDAMTREQMNLEVLKLWEESRKTVLFVTHSITEAIFLAKRVFVMSTRPARLARIIEIDLPYPRRLDVVNTERFGGYAREVRQLLNARGDLS